MTTSSQSISILGCGWLGQALGKNLAGLGYRVKGSTTRPEKQQELLNNQIQPFILDLNQPTQNETDTFLNSAILIIAIPPSGIDISMLRLFLQQATNSPINQLILISSTGIYEETNAIIDEQDLQALDVNSKLFQIESVIQSFPALNPVILRMAGLIGYDRQPVRYSKSPKVKANPNGRVNMIHRDDAVRIIELIISKGIKDEIFNCCVDQHPTKKEFYTNLAKLNQTEIPTFEHVTNDSFKIISNHKVKKLLKFAFMDLYYGL